MNNKTFKENLNDESSNKDNLKKIWKEEADQQRRDNLRKQKIVKKREVDIKFGGVKDKSTAVTKQPASTSKRPLSDSIQDDFARSRLGLH